MQYEQIVDTIRKAAGGESFVFPIGMVQHDSESDHMGETPLPHHVLLQAMQVVQSSDWRIPPFACLFHYDLWSLGIEWALNQLPRGTKRYGFEFIGGFDDRCGFEYMGDEGPEVKHIDALETACRKTPVATFEWTKTFIVHAHGMHSVELYLLGEYENRKLYKCDICEGEGYWASLFFAIATE